MAVADIIVFGGRCALPAPLSLVISQLHFRAPTIILGKSVAHLVLATIEELMATITKKELIDRIAEGSGNRRVLVKKVVQQFLDEIVNELGKGNRLEFRDFGVFETKLRKARRAQNPKTLEPVAVPEKRTVKFKVGRLMKQRLGELTGVAIDDEAGDVAEMSESHEHDEHDEDEGGETAEATNEGQGQPGGQGGGA